jgi:hypothetical protein
MSASQASLPLRVAAMEVYTRHMYRAFAQSAVDIQLFAVPSAASASAGSESSAPTLSVSGACCLSTHVIYFHQIQQILSVRVSAILLPRLKEQYLSQHSFSCLV